MIWVINYELVSECWGRERKSVCVIERMRESERERERESVCKRERGGDRE